MQRRNWSYEETLVAFGLYTQIPWEKISARNKEIIAVAYKMGRTPAALSMKLDNLARWDIAVTSKGFSSLTHGSNVEKRIWDEFYEDREGLLERIEQSRKAILKADYNDVVCTDEDFYIPEGSDKVVATKQRIGQAFFRRAVLSSYNTKCCITGIAVPQFLQASHIKPWKDSSAEEKTNPHNGLCLNLLHHVAFDEGFITISRDYRVMVSDTFKNEYSGNETTQQFIKYSEGKEILKPKKFLPLEEFLEYHRDVIFKR